MEERKKMGAFGAIGLVLLVILLAGTALLSAMLLCYEAYEIYNGYAEKNVPSEYAVSKKKNIFRRVAEAFFTPTFLLLVVLFVMAATAEFCPSMKSPADAKYIPT